MAKIRRTDVIQKAVNDLALNQTADLIPDSTLDKVQLTYGLNRQFSNFSAILGAASTTGTKTLTMPTIDTRQEIYITGFDASFTKDATCDVADGVLTITYTPDQMAGGVSTTLYNFPVITLTADSQFISVNYPYPIKIKPNVNLTFTGSYTVGKMVRALGVRGFITSSN